MGWDLESPWRQTPGKISEILSSQEDLKVGRLTVDVSERAGIPDSSQEGRSYIAAFILPRLLDMGTV